MTRWTVLVLTLIGALAGCALDPGQPPAPQPVESPSASDAAPSAPATGDPAASEGAPAGSRLTGVLGGDAELEGGCVWLDTDQGRIEPQWPEGYSTTTDPVALLDPDGEPIAQEGDRVTVTGSPAPDLATICQVGEVWNLTRVTVTDG
jgi:hypothetical protein